MLVFLENKVYAGDHVPWHIPLDGSESRIQHMLMAEDPQLNPITTPFGPVCFVQVTYHDCIIFCCRIKKNVDSAVLLDFLLYIYCVDILIYVIFLFFSNKVLKIL